MSAVKWLWGYARKYKLSMIFTGILTLGFVGSAFVAPIIPGLIVDNVILGGKHNILIYYCFALVGFTAIKELVIYMRASFCGNNDAKFNVIVL